MQRGVMKFIPLIFTLILTFFSLAGCTKQSANSFDEFTNTLFLEEITSNTINLHYSIEDPSAMDILDYDISLGDFSKESRENNSTYLRETLSTLLSYDYESLSLENQLTYDVLKDYLITQLNLCKYDLFQEPLSFSSGLQMELPILFAEYEFHTEKDVKDYLEMIALTDEYFNQIIEFEAEKSSNGLFMSPSQCEKVIDSCESFFEDKANHYLITSFESKLEDLDLSAQKTASYKRQNLSILEKQLFPAYDDIIKALSILKDTAANENGLCYLEKGKEYYELLVYATAGCQENIDALYRRIENQRMNDLLACALLQSEDDTLMETCSNLEWEMIHPEAMLSRLQTAILEDFPTPPECEYEIKYVEPALEEYLAPAFYIVAPLDHYTENTIYINDGYISSDIYAFTTLAHEGYPGHLYQTVMTYTYDYPNIRTILNYEGFVEGWATYIEMMAYDYAGLDDSIASFLSHNQATTLSLYASTDIGIHYYGWGFEETKAFWKGFGITDENAINEITQLILSEPGNYLKYYIGYIEFLELKEYAKDLFGDDYSDKQFHQAILDIGPAPFYIVEKYLPFYYCSPQT